MIKAKEASLQEPARDEEQSPVKAKDTVAEVGLVEKTLNKICMDHSKHASDNTGHAKKI